MPRKIIHVVGTGTIGEPLIGLLSDFKQDLGIDEITFHKNTPLTSDRSKVTSLLKRGARLSTQEETFKGFKEIGLNPSFTTEEAINRASVVIDCTPSGIGHKNKAKYYEKFLHNTAGFIAQGSEFGFGKMYARGINDSALDLEKDTIQSKISDPGYISNSNLQRARQYASQLAESPLQNVDSISTENIWQVHKKYIISDTFHTKVVKNKHGDSSGVRGAAWLS